MKRFNLTPLLLAFSALAFLACSSDVPVSTEAKAKAEAELTVEYLANNPDVLAKEQSRCNELKPIDAVQDPVCQNVILAQRKDRMKGYLDKGPDSKKTLSLPEPK